MENSEVVSTELECDGLNVNGKLENKIRGCKCAPEYKVAQTWQDGRIRLCTICDLSPPLMLDPDGTYRMRLYENLSEWPESYREGMRQHVKDTKEKNERLGCELQWYGKTYTFKGYY
jgi:hypothetical protein